MPRKNATVESLYRFVDADRSIEILRPDLPLPWINYLSNGTMHAFVSQVGGGFAWLGSPSLGRLTRYRMHNLPIDSPGFYIYLGNVCGGEVWSPTFRSCNAGTDEWRAVHRSGARERALADLAVLRDQRTIDLQYEKLERGLKT